MPMLIETSLLSSKIKISVDHEKLGNYSQSQFRFYLKYSSLVLRALANSSFQKFLRWMLTKEGIEDQIVKAVDVNVLPSRRKNGKGIAGNCNTARGRIRIYPKTIKFCQIFKRRFGRPALLFYAGNRARAALIHELLHLKYVEDERTVRELAEDYFGIFTQKRFVQSSRALCTLLFVTNSVEKACSGSSCDFKDGDKPNRDMFKSRLCA